MNFKIEGFLFGDSELKEKFLATDLGAKVSKSAKLAWKVYAVLCLVLLLILLILSRSEYDNSIYIAIIGYILLALSLIPISQECIRDGAYMMFINKSENKE